MEIKVLIKDYVDEGISDIYLVRDDGTVEETIEYRTGLDYELAESYIVSLYFDYKLSNDTEIVDCDTNDIRKLVDFVEV